MSTLQFSLFFVALIFAYLLVHYRLVRFEAYLRELAGLKVLNERLKGVSDVLERVRLDRVEEQLAQLHEDLTRIEAAQGRVERALARTSRPAPSIAAVGADGERSVSDRIRGAVENRLLTLGYGNLRILSELGDADLDDTLEVRVECDKGHMPYKGAVVTRNGTVVDVRLSPAAQAFP